jgi:hypothetical protein
MKNLALILIIGSISVSAAGQRVNFSGTWRLNREKSELGPRFSLAPKILTVDHRRKILDLTSETEFNGEVYQISQHFTLDGNECENKGFNDSVTHSTASYDKKSGILTIVTRGSVQDSGYTLTQTLSLQGGSLVITSEALSDMGEMNEIFVFDKFLPNQAN